MKRWHVSLNETKENAKADKFLADLIKVFEKHGMKLEHEDQYGAFEIVKNDRKYEWLKSAHFNM